MNKKDFIIKHEWILSRLFRLIGRNRISVCKGNSIHLNNVFMQGCQINILGSQNSIDIEPGLTRLKKCKITIKGSNCRIKIGRQSNLNFCNLYIEDDNGSIIIDEHVTTNGVTDLAVIEGKCIHIGKDSLFASDISFRVGDSHSILDVKSGQRINPSRDIEIGNHVWIGHSVKILKGAKVGNNSIIGTGSIVTGNTFPPHCIIAGAPAKIVKTDIDWCPQRI